MRNWMHELSLWERLVFDYYFRHWSLFLVKLPKQKFLVGENLKMAHYDGTKVGWVDVSLIIILVVAC